MDASFALQRFGLGPRFDFSGPQASALAADPRGALMAELRPEGAILSSSDLPASAEALVALFEQQKALKAMRDLVAQGPAAPASVTPKAAPAMSMAGPAMTNAKQADPAMHVQRDIFIDEAQQRFTRAFESQSGLMERLVWFWSNHFAVSVAKGNQVRATAGAFEREAIRPHVLGRFEDMLLAVEQHPAMLFYLDNRDSIGPNSKAGQRRQKGLNENLAREILELHTLGVNGGYSQGDVTNFARIITGWTVPGLDNGKAEPGVFTFNANAHEPGSFKVLGKAYAEDAQAQGEAVLRDLAHHPATARHLALKFARHFVADDPPPALVKRLSDNFLSTGGDLKALTATLLSSDESWDANTHKLRQPQIYILAATRALNLPIDKPQPLLGALKQLGQPLWEPPGPNGFGDTEAIWASAEGLKLRLDYASMMAAHARLPGDPRTLATTLLGERASTDTAQAIARAESRQQGLALLLMSPEFQRS